MRSTKKSWWSGLFIGLANEMSNKPGEIKAYKTSYKTFCQCLPQNSIPQSCLPIRPISYRNKTVFCISSIHQFSLGYSPTQQQTPPSFMPENLNWNITCNNVILPKRLFAMVALGKQFGKKHLVDHLLSLLCFPINNVVFTLTETETDDVGSNRWLTRTVLGTIYTYD